jgi:hypothetical protein
MVERRPLTATTDKPMAAANGGGPATFAAVQAEIAAAMAAGELSLPQKFEWFEKKLKAALSDSAVTTSELERIARETDVAIEVARQEAVAARERGLDLCADSRLAREAIEDAEFFVGRLLTQRPRLDALLHSRRQADQRAAYVVRFEQLKIEGELLGTELADLYPDAVRRMVEVFGRLRAFRERCRALHVTDTQGGSPRVSDPELKARRLDGFSRDVPSLLDAVHLHDWQSGTEIWPPRQPSFAADFAQTMTIPSVGAAWADPEVQERRRAEIAAQQEQMARHHSQMSRDQEALQNSQLRADWERRKNPQ